MAIARSPKIDICVSTTIIEFTVKQPMKLWYGLSWRATKTHGIPTAPTNKSAVAKLATKKFVTVCSCLSLAIKKSTSPLPTIETNAMIDSPIMFVKYIALAIVVCVPFVVCLQSGVLHLVTTLLGLASEIINETGNIYVAKQRNVTS